MLIALMDEARKTRVCEIEHEPEPRFVLNVDGYDYLYERRQDQPDGTVTYFLIDANLEIHDDARGD